MRLFEEYQSKKAAAKDLAGALALMNWDQETYMPSGAVARRAEQIGTLAAFRHRFFLTEVMPALEKALDAPRLSEFENINALTDYNEIQKAAKLPESFVSELARHASETQHVWESAKRENNFASFAPFLEKIVALKRREAEYYGYSDSPYDALLDDYEPRASAAHIQSVFDNLRPGLASLLQNIAGKQQPDDSFLRMRVESDMQWKFAVKVLKDMGFDFDCGRMDTSAHPFTTSFGPEDVRITSHLDEHNFMQFLGGAIHEGGHALYEQGLRAQYYGLPAGEPCSMSIHESQSRVWENVIGKSLSFWKHYFPAFAACFPDNLIDKTAEDVFRAVNKIEPSLIRIMADELTYHFHIILRFELERDLIEGRLKVKELPEAWNEKMQNYLGITPPTDREGCLQDIHWSCGLFGYFPTYTLGSLYACQLMDAALRDDKTLSGEIENGVYTGFHRWLDRKIFVYGKMYDSVELCMRATGKKLDEKHFLRYMQDKLTQVYG